MNIPDHTFLFTGFGLAHAAYSISDLPEGDFLIPLMIVEHEGKREVIRFEAETQEEAIEQGKNKIEEVKGRVDLWIFAREGVVASSSGGRVDVISIDGGSIDSPSILTVVLPFQPYHIENEFKIFTPMIVTVEGEALSNQDQESCERLIEEGVLNHPTASSLWGTWKQ